MEDITEQELLAAGITSASDCRNILEAFRLYERQKVVYPVPSAPVLPLEEASAPPIEMESTINTTECVVCMDSEVGVQQEITMQKHRFILSLTFIFTCKHLRQT